eukprot:7216532-Prymnesium_polylepis.1
MLRSRMALAPDASAHTYRSADQVGRQTASAQRQRSVPVFTCGENDVTHRERRKRNRPRGGDLDVCSGASLSLSPENRQEEEEEEDGTHDRHERVNTRAPS